MNKHPLLVSANAMLKRQGLHTTFKEENLLAVSLNKKTKEILYLVIEEQQFPGIVISLAIDCFQALVIADIIINLIHLAPVAMGEPFYRSNSGVLYWDEDAIEYFDLECNPELMQQLIPINDSFH